MPTVLLQLSAHGMQVTTRNVTASVSGPVVATLTGGTSIKLSETTWIFAEV
jgi:hypothetical protein